MKVKQIQVILIGFFMISSMCFAVDVGVKTSYLSPGSQDVREVFDSLMRKKINDLDGLKVIDDARYDLIVIISHIQFNNGTECYSLTLLVQENIAYGKKVDEDDPLFGAVRPIGVYITLSGVTIQEITECCNLMARAGSQLLADHLAKRLSYDSENRFAQLPLKPPPDRKLVPVGYDPFDPDRYLKDKSDALVSTNDVQSESKEFKGAVNPFDKFDPAE